MSGDEPWGLNILCIDGGGARGLSSLIVLREVMNRLEDLQSDGVRLNPADYFDVIAGSGTGGLSACMLGRLRMPLDSAIEEYAKLIQEVFADKKIIRTSGPSAYKGTKLREALERIIDKFGKGGEMMEEGNAEGCKTIVFAMSKHNMNAGLPTMFRSYPVGANRGPNCTILDTLRTTMAHHNLFKNIEIGEGALRQSFVSGDLGCSNPMAHVLTEVKRVYPGRHVSCILSIGAGHARTISIPDYSLPEQVFRTQDLATMKDMATDSERVAEEMAIRFGATDGVYFRFNVDQGVQDMKAGDWEKLQDVTAHAKAYLLKTGTDRRMEDLVRAIKKRTNLLEVESIDGQVQQRSRVRRGPRMRKCPAPTPVYTGRKDEEKQVVKCILENGDKRSICVIYGLGGSGKTQLALKVVERTRDKWIEVLYIDGTSRGTIESALKAFAGARNIGHTYQDAIDWLEFYPERWLIVFDNVDEPSVGVNLRRYIPGGTCGCVLITTRLADLAFLACGIGSVCHMSSGMKPEESLALFTKVARLLDQHLSEAEMKAAVGLMEDFGYLALAIVHAGAYISSSIRKVEDLEVSVYQEMNRVLGENHMYTLGCMIDLASTYLTRDRLDKAEELQTRVLGIQSELFGQDHPHTQKSITNLASIYLKQGRWDEAEKLQLQCLNSNAQPQSQNSSRPSCEITRPQSSDPRRQELISEKEFLNTLRAKANLALVYSNRDRLVEAEVLQNEILNAYRGKFTEEHIDTVASMLSLITIYCQQNRWDESAKLCLRVVELQTKILGEADSETVKSVARLAMIYSKQEQWAKAKIFQQRVVNSLKQTLGSEHLDTLDAIVELAMIHGKEDDWVEAESLQQHVVKSYQQNLGAEHVHTLGAMAGLTVIYSKQADWTQAESLQRRVVRSYEGTLGLTNTDTLRAMAELAVILSKRGHWAEAASLQEKVLRVYAESPPVMHRDLAMIIAGFAVTNSKLGKRVQDIDLLNRSWEQCKRELDKYNLNEINVVKYGVLNFSHGCLANEAVVRRLILDLNVQLLGGHNLDTESDIEISTAILIYLEAYTWLLHNPRPGGLDVPFFFIICVYFTFWSQPVRVWFEYLREQHDMLWSMCGVFVASITIVRRYARYIYNCVVSMPILCDDEICKQLSKSSICPSRGPGFNKKQVPAIGILQVTIFDACGLKGTKIGGGTPDPYVSLTINNRAEMARTKFRRSTHNPHWGEVKFLVINSLTETLNLTLLDHSDHRKDTELGIASFELSTLTEDATQEGLIRKVLKDGKERGEIKFDASFFPVLKPQTLDGGKIQPLPETKVGIVRLVIHQAKELDASNSMSGDLNPFAKLLIRNREIHKTNVMKHTLGPVWESPKEFLVTDKIIDEIDDSHLAINPVLGYMNIRLKDLLAARKEQQDWFPLNFCKSGKVRISADWKPLNMAGSVQGAGSYSPPIGIIRLWIKYAKDFKNIEDTLDGKSDPYVRVMLNAVTMTRTEVKNNNLNPEWNQIAYVPVHSLRETLYLECMDYQHLTKDRSLGFVELSVAGLARQTEDERVPYEGTGKRDVADPIRLDKGQVKGELHYTAEFIPALALQGIKFEGIDFIERAIDHAKDPHEYDDGFASEHESFISKKLQHVPLDITVNSKGHRVSSQKRAKVVRNVQNSQAATDTEESELDDEAPPDEHKGEGVKMTTEELLSQQSGILVFNIMDGQIAREARLEILLDDGCWPIFATKQSRSTQAHWDEVGEGFIKELEFGHVWLRLNENGEGEKEGIIAEFKLDAKQFLKEALAGPAQFTLIGQDGKNASTVRIQAKYVPVEIKLDPRESINNMGVLHVELVDGREIVGADRSGKSDPFVVFSLNGSKVYKSQTKKKTLTPEWKESFDVSVPSRVGADFSLEVFDWNQVEAAKPLGSGQIELADMVPFEVTARQIALSSTKHGEKGIIQIRMVFRPEIIAKSRTKTSTFSTAAI